MARGILTSATRDFLRYARAIAQLAEKCPIRRDTRCFFFAAARIAEADYTRPALTNVSANAPEYGDQFKSGRKLHRKERTTKKCFKRKGIIRFIAAANSARHGIL